MTEPESEFDPRTEWTYVRVLRFTPLPAVCRDADYLAEIQKRDTVEKVTTVEQIALVDIEVRGQAYHDCPLLRYLTFPGGAEIIELYWNEQASDEDCRAVTGAAFWACMEANHDPPCLWSKNARGIE